MTKLTCLIVDDEPLARDLLASHIGKVSFLELVGSCKNAIEARLALQEKQPDLMFLDINMPDLTGLDLLKTLPKPPATVFTTAFDLGAMDYLLKPIEFDRFFKSVSKVMDWIHPDTPPQAPATATLTPVGPTHIFVKSDARLVKVALQELHYVEALEKYVRLHLPNERIVTLMSMSQLLDLLPTDRFMRVHRSYIVQLAKVTSIEGNLLRIGAKEIPVSKSHREEVLSRIM
jgi:DNA-binding LytR/AlgR family response regulator